MKTDPVFLIMKLSDLQINPDNPRYIKEVDVQRLIEKLITGYSIPEYRKIAIDKKDNNLIYAGNQRTNCFKIMSTWTEDGLKLTIENLLNEESERKEAYEVFKPLIESEEIPDSWIFDISEMSDRQKKQLLVTDNINDGQFDYDVLANEYDIEELSKWMNLPIDWGADAKEDDPPPKEVATDDGYEIEIPEKPIVKKGDYIEIKGNGLVHRLYCGDATDLDHVKDLFKGDKCDLVITDPPYNLGYTGKRDERPKDRLKNDSMSSEDFRAFLKAIFDNLYIVSKDGATWYVWHADTEGHNFRGAMIDAGVKIRQCLIWVKQSLVVGRQDYHWQHEPCLYGWKPGAAHNWYSDRSQSTLLEFDRPTRSKEHPTMKPIPLIAYQMKNSSAKGDIIADLCGGSGTTMATAHQIERTCYMMELDPKFCDVIIKRMLRLDKNIRIEINKKERTSEFTKDKN